MHAYINIGLQHSTSVRTMTSSIAISPRLSSSINGLSRMIASNTTR